MSLTSLSHCSSVKQHVCVMSSDCMVRSYSMGKKKIKIAEPNVSDTKEQPHTW